MVMMMAARGIARVITGGQNTNARNDPFNQLATGQILGIPTSFVLAILIVVLVALLMRRTALGLMIESIGINPHASRLAGIRPRPILIAVYAFFSAARLEDNPQDKLLPSLSQMIEGIHQVFDAGAPSFRAVGNASSPDVFVFRKDAS